MDKVEDSRKEFGPSWWKITIEGEILNYADPRVRGFKKRVPLKKIISDIERAMEFEKISKSELRSILERIESNLLLNMH